MAGGLHLLARTVARQSQDVGFRGRLRIADLHMHEEAVELRLRQRKRAFLFDGILRGHHQEQRRQRIGVPAHGHLALAHRFEQRRLYLGRRAVDLVRQQQRVEDGPGLELEPSFLRPPDLGAREVGRQQIRRELHAREVGLQP